ncbi:MAG TPA: nicotinate (nicotinamide) nucleotide adenylyltransferase, partial [Nitrospirae bacterium]|nr:nicotinate (nicotinamide) nucleotide adenylyltransferase [Nitrospirota bacterium]
MKIGILGGTFNPIHFGHLRAAEEVREMFALDKVLFIPSGRPPFRKPLLADAGHRYKMTRLAIKGDPVLDISHIEIKAGGTSYSVDTLERLSSRYGNAKLFFIIGIDVFLDLAKWKQPDRLMELASLVIIARPGYCFTDLSGSPYFTTAHKKLLKRFAEGAGRRSSLTLTTGRKIFLCKITALGISASG